MIKFRRLMALTLSAVIAFGTVCVNADRAEVVKSYYLLKYEYQGFLEPLYSAGVKESELIEYFGDIEDWINGHDDVNEQTIEEYVERAVFTVSTYNEHTNVTAALAKCYDDEIGEYITTDVVPERLQGVYEAVMTAILWKDLPDKSALAIKYEELLKEFNANSSKYTESAVDSFRTELNKAGAVLKNREATQEQTDNALAALTQAYAELLKNVKPSTGGGSGSSGGGGGGGGGGSAKPAVPSTGTQDKTEEPDKSENDITSTQKPETPDVSYIDVNEDYWGYTAIMQLSKEGVLNGFDDNTFRPEELLTREQFAKILACALKLEDRGKTYTYTDVIDSEWYKPYIDIVTDYGIMSGIGEQKFGTGDGLLRQDMALVVYRLYKDGYCAEEEIVAVPPLTFSDTGDISEYAIEAVRYAHALGFINGMGNNLFMPMETVTRAQAAQVIYNMLNK